MSIRPSTALFLATAALLLPAGAHAQVAGNSGGLTCDKPLVQDAINAAPAAAALPAGIVYVRPGTYAENLSINNKNVVIMPGNANCNGPAPLGSRVDIVSPVGRTVEIRGNSNVTLQDLTLQSGSDSVGGNLLVTEQSVANLVRTEVEGGTASVAGGGIAIDDCSTVVVDSGSAVFDNYADLGGGIHVSVGACGGPSYLTVRGEVHSNTADQDGAGIYLASESSLTLDLGARVHSNIAQGNGGGIYAEWSSIDVTGAAWNPVVAGVPTAGARVEDNQAQGGFGGGFALLHSTLSGDNLVVATNSATGEGGGMMLEGSSAVLTNSIIQLNSAGTLGGGAAVFDESFFSLATDLATCNAMAFAPITDRFCAEIRENDADQGGGVYATSGITLDMVGMYSNQAATNGTALVLAQPQAGWTYQTSLVNTAVQVDQAQPAAPPWIATVDVQHPDHILMTHFATFAGNPATNNRQVHLVFQAGTTGNLSHSVIDRPVAPPPGFFALAAAPTAALSGTCNVVGSGAVPNPAASNVLGAFALLNGAWRNEPFGPAVNWCARGGLPTDARGAARPAGGTAYDSGAIEI